MIFLVASGAPLAKSGPHVYVTKTPTPFAVTATPPAKYVTAAPSGDTAAMGATATPAVPAGTITAGPAGSVRPSPAAVSPGMTAPAAVDNAVPAASGATGSPPGGQPLLIYIAGGIALVLLGIGIGALLAGRPKKK